MLCGKNGGVERDIILVHLALRRSRGAPGEKAPRRIEPATPHAVEDCMNIQYGAINYAQQLEAAKLSSRIDTLESSLRSETNLLKWMNGLTLALVIGLYVRSWLAWAG